MNPRFREDDNVRAFYFLSCTKNFFPSGCVNWGANAANTNIISAVNVVTPCVLVDDRIMSLIALTTPIRELGQVHMKESYVYILASKYNGTLYIGMT